MRQDESSCADAAVEVGPRDAAEPVAAAAGGSRSGGRTTSGDTAGRREAVVFAVLGTVQVVLILAITILSVGLPVIQRELGLSDPDLALVSASYGISFSGLLLLGGRLADAFGRRRICCLGLAVFVVSGVAAGLASDRTILLVARFGQGAGAALAAPAAMALIGTVYPDPVRRTRAIGVWGTLAALGGTLGMLLSGVVVTWASWRWSFALPAVLAAIAGVLLMVLFKRDASVVRQPLDLPGAILVTAALTTLSYGLVEVGNTGWSSRRVVAMLSVTAVLSLAFACVEARARNPLLPRALLTPPSRLLALLTVILASSAIATVFFLLSLYFQRIRGLSAVTTSAAFLPFSLTLIVMGLLVQRLLDRYGAAATLFGGLLVAAAGLMLISTIDVHSPYAGPLLAGILLFPIGASGMFAGSTVEAVRDVAEEHTGLAAGVVNSVMEAGPAVGLAILATVAINHGKSLARNGADSASAAAGGYGRALVVAAAVFLVAAVLIGWRVCWERWRNRVFAP